MKNIKKKSGFSLIEVLIFVSILSVFFVVAAAVSVATMRNLQLSEHKILATRYSEELLEWLRAEEEDDFEAFLASKVPSGTPTTFCYNGYDATGNLTSTSGACSSYSLGNPTIFKREALFTKLNQTQVQVDITVSWNEVGVTQTAKSSAVFNVLEQ